MNYNYTKQILQGGDLASTSVTKPEVHVEQASRLVKLSCKLLVANDRNFAGEEVYAEAA